MTIEISQENRQKLSPITSGRFYNKNTHFFPETHSLTPIALTGAS